jgi:hypothetical protein
MYDLIPEEDAYGSHMEELFYQFVLKIKKTLASAKYIRNAYHKNTLFLEFIDGIFQRGICLK